MNHTNLFVVLSVCFLIIFSVTTWKVYRKNQEYSRQFKHQLYGNKDHLLTAAATGFIAAFVVDLVILIVVYYK